MAVKKNELSLSCLKCVGSYLSPFSFLDMHMIMINSEQMCGALGDSFPDIITVGDISIKRKTMKCFLD